MLKTSPISRFSIANNGDENQKTGDELSGGKTGKFNIAID